MKLIYITENINAVFYSQVVELLNAIAKKNYFDEIYLAIGLRNPESIKKIETLNPKVHLITFKTYPMYPLFNTFTTNSLVKTFKKLNIDENYIIHTRIEFLGALAYKAFTKLHNIKPNMLIDVRGVVIEEVKFYGNMPYILKFLKLLNYKRIVQDTFNNTTYINTVSYQLKNYLKSHYDVNMNNISVIPTIAGENFYFDEERRNEIRNELRIKNKEPLFVFSSGSSQTWQNNDEIVKLLTHQGYKILMLTKKKYDNPNVISRFVPYTEVSAYLNAADIGIIVRNDDVVNNVASPIKFSEYIACGLPIIANKSVDTINSFREKTHYGRIMMLSDLNQEIIDDLLLLDKKKISIEGINNFGINEMTERYFTVYKKMSKDYM